uniref:Uncharacterized protein n=1 Tax=Anguilla anguilla TaxID=7936 RepID=A0A0E9U9Y8_ANGAN
MLRLPQHLKVLDILCSILWMRRTVEHCQAGRAVAPRYHRENRGESASVRCSPEFHSS